MELKPYKFNVVAVVQQHEDSRGVVGELVAEPVTLYGLSALTEWVAAFPDTLAEKSAEMSQAATE